MAVVIYSPIYNEMPWTPYFLKSLLEWDCPIVIAEGAADTIQRNNERSTDGSLELIKMFADEWKDRVSLYYHKYHWGGNAKSTLTKRQRRLPKAKIKIDVVWKQMLEVGDWMVGLAPDNYYNKADTQKFKNLLLKIKPQDEICSVLTGTKVFNYSFKNLVASPIKGICGSWIKYWPCTYKKNPKWVLIVGDELLRHSKTNSTRLVSPECQWYGNYRNSYVKIADNLTNFHYKGVKMLYTSEKRLGSQRARRWMNLSMGVSKNRSCHRIYTGPHPEVLDDHPWRHVEDCRKDQQDFNWKDFTHLVRKNSYA